MGTREIKSRFLTNEQIRDSAEDFRINYIHNEDIPVNIEWVIGATLGIQIIPLESLQQDCDMDGLISKNLKYIYVDRDLYEDDGYYNRIRFTIGHEIGHYVLHYDIIHDIEIEDEVDWIKFRLNMDEDELGWFERQAHEFAGRLLVPVDPLVKSFMKVRAIIVKKKSWMNRIDNQEIIAIAAPIICKHFGVSAEVIERRLRKEHTVQERLGL